MLVIMKCDKLGRSHVFVCFAAPNSCGKTKLVYELLVFFLLKVNNDLCYRDFNTELRPLINLTRFKHDLTKLQSLTAFMPCPSCLVFQMTPTGTKLRPNTGSGRESVLTCSFEVIVNRAFSSSAQICLSHRHKTEAEYWMPQVTTERIY